MNKDKKNKKEEEKDEEDVEGTHRKKMKLIVLSPIPYYL
jgi:hypothetical protein